MTNGSIPDTFLIYSRDFARATDKKSHLTRNTFKISPKPLCLYEKLRRVANFFCETLAKQGNHS